MTNDSAATASVVAVVVLVLIHVGITIEATVWLLFSFMLCQWLTKM